MLSICAINLKDECLFDFATLSHVEPLSMAIVSSEIKRSIQKNPNIRFLATNYKRHEYAAHMGFFQAFGLDYGKKPGEANGSSTYIPLTILNAEKLREEALENYEHIGDVLEKRSNELARILVREEDTELVKTLTFSLREIMRNVVEHSESQILEYCAQYWPSKNKVEIVVLDAGIGIKNSLSNNPYLTIETDRDAIHQALLPSISGKMYKGIKRRSSDVWQNSGFGLYMANRICRNGGSFLYAAAKADYFCSKAKKLILKHLFKVLQSEW